MITKEHCFSSSFRKTLTGTLSQKTVNSLYIYTAALWKSQAQHPDSVSINKCKKIKKKLWLAVLCNSKEVNAVPFNFSTWAKSSEKLLLPWTHCGFNCRVVVEGVSVYNSYNYTMRKKKTSNCCQIAMVLRCILRGIKYNVLITGI